MQDVHPEDDADVGDELSLFVPALLEIDVEGISFWQVVDVGVDPVRSVDQVEARDLDQGLIHHHGVCWELDSSVHGCVDRDLLAVQHAPHLVHRRA